jgi:basic membrane protein A
VATYGGINIPTVTIFMDGFAEGVEYFNEQKGATSSCSAGTRKPRTAPSSATSTTRAPARPTPRTSSTRAPTSSCPSPGPVGLGTLDASSRRTKAGKKTTVVWVDSDGYETAGKGEEFILTSVMKLMGDAVEEVISTDVEGNFDNTPYVGTLENGGVALAPFHDQEPTFPKSCRASSTDQGADRRGRDHGGIRREPEVAQGSP